MFYDLFPYRNDNDDTRYLIACSECGNFGNFSFNDPIHTSYPEVVIVGSKINSTNEELQANGGSERSGLDNANIIVGATSFAQGAQENIIALDKSLNNLKYTKGLKVAGRGLYVVQVGIAGYNTYNAWSKSDGNWRTNDGNKWGVTGKAALDVTIGAVAVWGGPVGWVVGGVYFIGDAAGWWGDWGKPE